MGNPILYFGDHLKFLQGVKDNSVKLVVTSPPYDNLDFYQGYARFQFDLLAPQLYRVIESRGVLVWVVADATIDASESGTSFKQALAFMQLGFKLHDTMIYLKTGMSKPSTTRYHQVFEYMFVLSKDGPPATFNPIKDRRNVNVGAVGKNVVNRRGHQDTYGMRFNVWQYDNGKNHTARYDDKALECGAPFPEGLARDHVLSWSNKGDVVFDPMMGSGTVGKMALLLEREFMGCEINPNDYKIAESRILSVAMQERLF